MKHKVSNLFTDKESGVLYILDSLYVSNDYERVKHLEKLGFIVANQDVELLKVVEKQAPKRNSRKKKVSEDDVTED